LKRKNLGNPARIFCLSPVISFEGKAREPARRDKKFSKNSQSCEKAFLLILKMALYDGGMLSK